jgi:hypothetical protein
VDKFILKIYKMYSTVPAPQGFEPQTKFGKIVREEKTPEEKSLVVLNVKLTETKRYGDFLDEADRHSRRQHSKAVDTGSLLEEARRMPQIAYLNTDILAAALILRAYQDTTTFDFSDSFATRLVEKVVEQTLKKKEEKLKESVTLVTVRTMVEIQRYGYALS